MGLQSYQEPCPDTTSPFGAALYYITMAYAQLERGVLAEQNKAAMDRAKRQSLAEFQPPIHASPCDASRDLGVVLLTFRNRWHGSRYRVTSDWASPNFAFARETGVGSFGTWWLLWRGPPRLPRTPQL